MKRKKNKRRRRAKKKAETKSQPCGFPNIPEEIIVEILSRLSRGSLSRFTCVSKQWRSLVSDIISKVTRRNMVLIQSVSRSGAPTFYSIDEESHEKQVRRPWKKSISPGPPIFFGSCNGLVLLNITHDLYLWNPITSYIKKVLSYNRLADASYRVVSGLCYDSLSDEYKALLGLFNYEWSPGNGGEFFKVGSFKSKDWRMVGFPYLVGTVQSGPVINGNLHWYGRKSRFLPGHQIFYFNPHLNNFRKVPMPEPKHNEEGDMFFGLGVLDGCLSLVRHDNPRNYECHNVEVLTRKEYHMKKSWTLLFIISNLTLRHWDILEPLCYTKDGEALMKVSTQLNGNIIRAYNVNDSLHREISNYIDAIKYEESLIEPTGYNWEEEELRGEATYTDFWYRTLFKYKKGENGSWDFFELRDFEQQNSEEDELETDEE